MSKSKLLINFACVLALPAAMHAQAVRVFLTSKASTDRLTEQAPLSMQPMAATPLDSGAGVVAGPTVFVDPTQKCQTIEGFGGAFTESAATVLNKMSPANRTQILKDYFDPVQGIGYSVCRTHINSCDFSLSNYSYDDTPGDTALKDFSIAHDQQALIPLIKDAIAIKKSPIKLFASPWSPPAWMKTNNQMNNGGKLKAEDAQAWADYFVRYVQEYKKAGIDIWGLTVQNEPAASQKWDSCQYSGAEERDFVRDHLGPTLEKAGMSKIKLMVWDHNYDQMLPFSSPSYNDPQTSKYFWGTAVHWYSKEQFENITKQHELWPDKATLFTEGCQEGGPHNGDWKTAERYGRNIMGNLNNWSVGFTDWNIVLDQTGGPNHAGNLCSAPILADVVNDKILLQPSYYYIGQFSRFIQPGAKRLVTSTGHPKLLATAAVNPTGETVVVVLNLDETKIDYNLKVANAGLATSIPAHSLATYVISK